MIPQQFSIFFLSYFLVACLISVVALIHDRSRWLNYAILLLTIAGLTIATIVGSLLYPGENFLLSIGRNIISLSRMELLAFCFGVSCALPLILYIRSYRQNGPSTLAYLIAIIGVAGTLLFAGLSAGKDLISPYLPNPNTELSTEDFGKLTKDEFVIEDFLETDIIPIRIDVSPKGRIFVSGHLGIAAQAGAVSELIVQQNGTVIERRVADMLNRPYGLIARDDYLLVSRSGQYTRWNKGKAEQISTGAVTILKDLDNDGVMDYYNDVVSGLPGAKGPDYLHQNNGIAIGPDGSLYITTANHTDGNPVEDPMAGAILKASGEDFSDLEIYATGLRNPFGLQFSQDGELFATDNDAQAGFLGGNMGDKLLHVREGAFYGHPFGSDDDEDVMASALRSKFALGGLALANSEKLPESYRGSLFVVVYGEGRIMQVDLTLIDGQYKAELKPFAIVPGAVDIAAAPSGDFYIVVYPNKVVRLRLK